jgi:hypothetical protein
VYPSLRITARFLRVDYHRIFLGSHAVTDGIYALCKDIDKVGP